MHPVEKHFNSRKKMPDGYNRTRMTEMGEASFSDYDSASLPKFLKPHPGQKSFQIWESDSCLNSGNHRFNRNPAMFCWSNDIYTNHADSCYCWKKWHGFRVQFFTNIWVQIRVRKKPRIHSGSVTTSDILLTASLAARGRVYSVTQGLVNRSC